MKTPTREDYELAAKAAGGKKLLWYSNFNFPFLDRYTTWQPLDDDGDSRQLENAIGPDVLRSEGRIDVYQNVEDMPRLSAAEHYADHNGDKAAATRAAVFWLAVEIGRSM